ncbi:MAG: fumarylacetoacetate hydrolase family protein [Pirellulaceae bacterium]
MRIAKYLNSAGEVALGEYLEEGIRPFKSQQLVTCLADIWESQDPLELVKSLVDEQAAVLPLAEVKLLPPIDRQEVWAAGVTYTRSKTARMEESESSADCYDRVYNSPRPELFMKASPHRVRGPGQPLRIRLDSHWNVPEPEFTLVVNSRLEIVGYTIGNDMSSRDIEGENPLYLPQAKVYDACCGLGPCIALVQPMRAQYPELKDIAISSVILRDGKEVFSGQTNLGQLARSLEGLVEYLGRDQSFPDGVFLLTGTGIVPDNDFTLEPADVVEITISGIGTLSNPITQG